MAAALDNVSSMATDYGSVMDTGTKLSVLRFMKQFETNDKHGLLATLSDQAKASIQEVCTM